ncbi:MAG TPA: N-acetylmuramoyl-L-alanine amidase [Stellaceae bacterium]|nr:N-acetylmuramoyl-L-alanine amidase [Stellaceae bacterium]
MTMRSRLSPNHEPRPSPGRIDLLILHYTGMTSAEEALDRLCDPAAEVSAHYLVDEDGTVWRLVDENRRAWHAGRGFWAGATNINDRSIGIELVNPGHEHGYRPFPELQITALETLAHDILARHPIAPERVLGHSDIAPGRKADPGELFPWERLAGAGIGLWPDFAEESGVDGTVDILAAQRSLARIGYDARASGRLDGATQAILTAFQRHWRPASCSGALDAETAQRIALCAKTAAPPP